MTVLLLSQHSDCIRRKSVMIGLGITPFIQHLTAHCDCVRDHRDGVCDLHDGVHVKKCCYCCIIYIIYEVFVWSILAIQLERCG